MGSSEILRSQPANDDLEAIWNYLAIEASPEIADFVIARLYEAMRRAADNPLLYRPRPGYRGRPRRINVFEYAIFYEPLDQGLGIFVWRIIHGRRDLTRQIQPRPGLGTDQS